MVRSSFPRRQQHRRLCRAAGRGATAVAAGVLAIIAAGAHAPAVAVALVFVTIGLVLDSRRLVSLGARSRVGAHSEDKVQRALAQLEGEGWRLRHSLRWRRRGDIDSVAIAPTGVAFAIETKTRTFDARHVSGVREMALWLHRRRRRWCRGGALPVLCVVRARGLERVEGGVLIVSLDRLVPALQVAAGLSKRPAFLAGVWLIRPDRGISAPVRARSLGPACRRVAGSARRGLGDSLLDAASGLRSALGRSGRPGRA